MLRNGEFTSAKFGNAMLTAPEQSSVHQIVIGELT